MEALEEVATAAAAAAATAASAKDLCQIVKGKRTKRQRPQSPIPFTIPTTHSSSGDGGSGSNGDGDCIDNNTNTSSTSDDLFLNPTKKTTKEDEDLAKCLILLARGDRDNHHHHHLKETLNKIDRDHNLGNEQQKFTSKRYIETPISANGKAGMYVYQCKTCGRTFPSFQALGGHRASHKKPKNMAAAEERKMFLASDDDEEEPINRNGNRNRRISSLTLELGSRGMYTNFNTDLNKSSTPTMKVHECSYCGAEFTSGQALGGHMRRHRGATISTTTNTTLSLSPISRGSIDQENDEPEAKRSRNGFALDLNLPAPEADHNGDSGFTFVSKQQQQQQKTEQQEKGKKTTLVISTGRLVECEN